MAIPPAFKPLSPAIAARLKARAEIDRQRFLADKYARIMPDSCCDAVWDRDHCAGYAYALPISASLKARLAAWAESYEALILARDDGIPSGNLGPFSMEGFVIAKAIKRELPDWSIIYHHLEKASKHWESNTTPNPNQDHIFVMLGPQEITRP